MMTFFLPGIAVLFAIGSYGLMHRTIWAWYLGLGYLQVMTGWILCSMLCFAWKSGTQPAVLHVCAAVIGILCFWLCGLLWWLKRKGEFRSWY